MDIISKEDSLKLLIAKFMDSNLKMNQQILDKLNELEKKLDLLESKVLALEINSHKHSKDFPKRPAGPIYPNYPTYPAWPPSYPSWPWVTYKDNTNKE